MLSWHDPLLRQGWETHGEPPAKRDVKLLYRWHHLGSPDVPCPHCPGHQGAGAGCQASCIRPPGSHQPFLLSLLNDHCDCHWLKGNSSCRDAQQPHKPRRGNCLPQFNRALTLQHEALRRPQDHLVKKSHSSWGTLCHLRPTGASS